MISAFARAGARWILRDARGARRAERAEFVWHALWDERSRTLKRR